VVNATLRPLYPRERPDTHGIGGWVATGPVSTGAENFIPPGFDSRAVQLYRLRYPGQCSLEYGEKLKKLRLIKSVYQFTITVDYHL
jgi:hypothetical protein